MVVAQGPGHWADPQRAATDVATAVRLTGIPGADVPAANAANLITARSRWLAEWRKASDAAARAADAVLAAEAGHGHPLSEPVIARQVLAALPAGALLWVGSSMPIRDVDAAALARADASVLSSRGASGIDGTTSTAVGAALAHAAGSGDAPAFALIGDLAFVHDAPGLAIGPGEPRPDLCVVVVNNDGGGIFETLEPAAFAGPFERVFGTPHGASLEGLAAAFGVPYTLVSHPDDLAKALRGTGLRVVEARTDRAANADLRARMRAAAVRAVAENP